MTYPVLPANGPSGYNLTNSLRFRSSASAYLNRTFSTPTSAYKWTLSFWIKLGTGATTNYVPIFGAGATPNNLVIDMGSAGLRLFAPNTGATLDIETSQVFRDPSAWYHVIYAVDTTQATASNRIKLYINGSQVTALSIATYPALNATFYVNQNATAHYIGNNTGSSYFDGYLAEVNFIDGQALTPSSFGSTNSTTGVWQPAKYSGSYGTNGFYLNFSNIALTSGSNTGLGKDYSGNGNYWNTNNISVTAGTTYDAMTDVPTLTSATVANYAVLNPVNKNSNVTVANGNLSMTCGTTGQYTVLGTMGITSGKWYFEAINAVGFNNAGLGFANDSFNVSTSTAPATNCWIIGQYVASNQFHTNSNGAGNVQVTSTVTSASEYLVCAIDYDAGKAWFGKSSSGTLTWFPATLGGTAGNPATGTNPTITFSITTPIYPLAFNYSTGSAASYFNFGQQPFNATPPTGFVALNTYNLPTPTILQGNKYMDATLYAGDNNGSTQIVNASGFKPDFVWLKNRTLGTTGSADHMLYDSVRGVLKNLSSNLTDAEGSLSTGLSAFNSNGFTPGSSTRTNATSSNYVGWQWQAGQGSTSSNTSGSITSTVSVNASAGFSIVTYTGTGANATVGHGLGVAPKMVIVKNRSIASAWRVWFTGFAGTEQLNLNETTAKETGQITWNSTVPTSTVFSLGTPAAVNGSGNTCVAYCWAEIAGFSKFGSYVGNGSSDGPMVYCNFAPKFVMFKRTDTTSGWYIQDSTRNTSNVVNLRLLPNTSDAEATVTTLDFLSNGFKLRTSDVDRNASGGTYIYACFASNPFRNSNAF